MTKYTSDLKKLFYFTAEGFETSQAKAMLTAVIIEAKTTLNLDVDSEGIVMHNKKIPKATLSFLRGFARALISTNYGAP